MSYGRFFACGNKLLSPTMEPDLTIVMTLVKTRFLIKKLFAMASSDKDSLIFRKVP